LYQRTIISFLLSIVCLISNICISQQKQKTDQYRAILLTQKDGLSADGMNTMIKDVKGFIWIGSLSGGFCRFDGIRFKKYLPKQNDRRTINSDRIISFTEDSLHNIWIGTDKGFSRYDIKADTFTHFSPLIDTFSSTVFFGTFCATKDEVFCGERLGVISAYNIHTLMRRTVVKLPMEDDPGMKFSINNSWFDTKTNSLWVLPQSKPDRLQQIFPDGKVKYFPWPCFKNNIDHPHFAEDMSYDRKRNSLWINSSDGLLEFTLKDQKFLLPGALNEITRSKEYDRDVGVNIDIYDRIWFATKSHGILIYDPQTARIKPVFSDQDPQKKAGDANLHIYCDRDGIVWTSNWMANGVYKLLPFDPSVKRYGPKPGIQDSLSDGFVISIVPASQGKIWVGTSDGLNIFDPGTEKFEVLQEKDLPGIKGKAITPLHVDTVRQLAWLYAGSVNFLTKAYEMYVYEMDIKTKRCRRIIFRDGARQFDTLNIEPNLARPYKDGLFICTDFYGLFEIKPGSLFADLVVPLYVQSMVSSVAVAEESMVYFKLYEFLPNINFENKNSNWEKLSHPLDNEDWVFMIYNKKDQTYWVSFKYKLMHYDKDFKEIKTYTQEDGYSGAAQRLVLDNAGNLWFVNMLEQVGRLNVSSGIITMLSEADGYLKKDFDWGVPLTKDTKGNLYFGTGSSKGNKGLDIIYPEKYSSAATSSVYLLSLTVNQKPFAHSVGVNNLEKLSLRYNQNTISIETGIIDFYANGKGHIRYKLKENDNEGDWQYSDGAYYTIRYEKLPPGKYDIILQASNEGNEFNSPEKTIAITIHPPFWQTWWFRSIAVVALLLLLYGIYHWRTATLRKQKRVLEQTVKERTAEVVEEKAKVERQKEKSDELLLNILPSEVADELKEKGYTTAKSFDEVTVLFSDIKGFTNVAEKLTAQELVKEINTYFSAFDNIILKYGLEKIKTIGDAYIAAGGLPEKNSAKAQNVIEAAIAMQKIIQELKQERISSGKPYFELRIGIHTGPVVAGVVGIKKFQYDIWGDTVNLAARMEQSGVPGKINISKHTYELVKDQFTCVHRGKIEAKNKGDIDMYFVEL